MVFTIEKLKRDVMARLGEIPQPLPSLAVDVPGPADIVSLKVESMLPGKGSRLLREASLEMLGAGCQSDVEVTKRKMPCGLYAAEIRLPEGFLRLVSVKMRSWDSSVSKVILPGLAEWECQWSAEPGIAGCPSRPRAYLDGKILRVVASNTEDDTLERFCCWNMPIPDSEGSFEFPDLLYPELVGALSFAHET